MTHKITIKGQKELEKYVKKLADPGKYFDEDYRKTAVRSNRELKITTNKQTGTTARSWQLKKLGLSSYINFNDVKTDDKQHLIANILNYGRDEIRPKPTNRRGLLFIPLTELGRSRSGQFGIDWVFAKKAKAFKGTKFMDKEEARATKQLIDLMVKRIGKG